MAFAVPRQQSVKKHYIFHGKYDKCNAESVTLVR